MYLKVLALKLRWDEVAEQIQQLLELQGSPQKIENGIAWFLDDGKKAVFVFEWGAVVLAGWDSGQLNELLAKFW